MARRALVWSGPAIDDLREARAYTARDEPAAARRLAGKIREQVLLLRDQPLLGRVVPELEPRGFREVIVGRYRIVYEVEERRVVILRVWHGKRRMGARDVQP
jgi:addiction module RelE/StbE family toxin